MEKFLFKKNMELITMTNASKQYYQNWTKRLSCQKHKFPKGRNDYRNVCTGITGTIPKGWHFPIGTIPNVWWYHPFGIVQYASFPYPI